MTPSLPAVYPNTRSNQITIELLIGTEYGTKCHVNLSAFCFRDHSPLILCDKTALLLPARSRLIFKFKSLKYDISDGARKLLISVGSSTTPS